MNRFRCFVDQMSKLFFVRGLRGSRDALNGLRPCAAAIAGDRLMGGFQRFAGVAICALALAVASYSQVTPAWGSIYNGPGSGEDLARALAVDAAGNVYVTGQSFGAGTNFDFATIKYDSGGNQLWVDRYNGPGNGADDASALAVDAAGNVCVTGESWNGSNLDYATIKYNTSGNRQWVARYNGPGNADDSATALAVDAVGNVYVTGDSWNGSNHDYATIKYDPNGNQLWVSRYNGPGNADDYATALAVDMQGNVYVTGWSDSTGIAYATIKYDPNGNQLWTARFHGPTNEDLAQKLAVDSSGNVYVTGWSAGTGTDFDYGTIKYDANGNQLWVARYNGPGNGTDDVHALVVDAAGNVYVSGFSKGAGTGFDFATIKYDSNGNELWVARYNGLGNRDDGAFALALDWAGNVYVTGPSGGAGSGSDAVTIKYDANGRQAWTTRTSGLGSSDDSPLGIAVDTAGNVYIAGYTNAFGTYDYATVKYVPCLAPTAFEVFRGVLEFGGLPELAADDDVYLVIRNGITALRNESPITLRVSAVSPVQTPSSFQFSIENRVSITGLTQRVDLFDYTAGAFVNADTRTASTTDTLVSVTGGPANVESGTSNIKSQLRIRADGPVFTNTWRSYTDQTAWIIS